MKFEDPENPDLVTWKCVPLGTREEVIAAICRTFTGAQFSSEASGTYEGKDFFLEFYLSSDPCEGFMVAVRGGGSAIIEVARSFGMPGIF